MQEFDEYRDYFAISGQNSRLLASSYVHFLGTGLRLN